MKEILDDEGYEEVKNKRFFSILAFICAMMTSTILLFLLIYSISGSNKLDTAYSLGLFMGVGMNLSSLVGFISSLISLFRKEKIRYIKAIGIGLNFLYALVILGLLLYFEWYIF